MADPGTGPRPPKRLRFRWWWLGLAAALLLVVAVFAFATLQPIQVLPRIRLAPGFSLIDQNGEQLTNEDLRGSFVLYNFTYTDCEPPCHNLDATMREVQDRLVELDLGDVPVQLVTISFDPENDTPEVLRAHARSAGADPATWRFATGDPTRLKSIIGSGFEVYYEPDEAGGFRFDPAFVLVDGWGIIRGEYHYQSLAGNADRFLRHLSVLAEELAKSKGAAKVAYEAAHLFLCYAD